MMIWMYGARAAVWAALLVAGVQSATALAQDAAPHVPKPPAELAGYFDQVRKAEAIEDPEQRCLAYPDLPGNQWPEGAAAGRCGLVVRKTDLPLDELQSILADADGAAKLEARMQALLDAHYAEPRQRDHIFRVFDRFDGGIQAGAVATAWLRKAPRSPFAMTAMGSHRTAKGWDARGGAYSARTSKPQLQRMTQEFNGAIPLLVQALELEPRLTPACRELAAMGRMSSDALQQHSLTRCLQVDPLSAFLVAEWMSGAMPKWGGSAEQMAVVAAYARKHGPQNPALYAQLAESVGYEARQLNSWDVSHDIFIEASRAAPNFRMMRDAGRGFWRNREDPWMALVYWSQVLRFWPDDMKLRGFRGKALHEVKEFERALEDLLPAIAAEPEDVELQYATGASLVATDRLLEARPHLERAMKVEGWEPFVLELYCYTFLGLPGGSLSREAQDCTARLVEAMPTNGHYWSWRYRALMDVQDERWPEAAAQFIRHADRSSPAQMMLRKDLLDSGVEP